MSSVPSAPGPEFATMHNMDQKLSKDPVVKDDVQNAKKVATDMRSQLMSWLWWGLCILGNCVLYVGFYSLVSSILAYRLFPLFQRELQKFPHYHSVSPDVIFTRFWEWVTFYHTIQWIDNIVTGGRLQKFLKDKASTVQLAQS